MSTLLFIKITSSVHWRMHVNKPNVTSLTAAKIVSRGDCAGCQTEVKGCIPTRQKRRKISLKGAWNSHKGGKFKRTKQVLSKSIHTTVWTAANYNGANSQGAGKPVKNLCCSQTLTASQVSASRGHRRQLECQSRAAELGLGELLLLGV